MSFHKALLCKLLLARPKMPDTQCCRVPAITVPVSRMFLTTPGVWAMYLIPPLSGFILDEFVEVCFFVTTETGNGTLLLSKILAWINPPLVGPVHVPPVRTIINEHGDAVIAIKNGETKYMPAFISDCAHDGIPGTGHHLSRLLFTIAVVEKNWFQGGSHS